MPEPAAPSPFNSLGDVLECGDSEYDGPLSYLELLALTERAKALATEFLRPADQAPLREFALRLAEPGTDDEVLRRMLKIERCVRVTYPEQGRHHVESLDTKVQYNSFPPTSGPHYTEPAEWDSYDEPVNPLQLVHNLEVGGIVVNYGSEVSGYVIDNLRSSYEEDHDHVILAPLPGLGDKIAFSAWRTLVTCHAEASRGAVWAYVVPNYRFVGEPLRGTRTNGEARSRTARGGGRPSGANAAPGAGVEDAVAVVLCGKRDARIRLVRSEPMSGPSAAVSWVCGASSTAPVDGARHVRDSV